MKNDKITHISSLYKGNILTKSDFKIFIHKWFYRFYTIGII